MNLSRLFRRRLHSLGARRSATLRLFVETLEDRTLLSGVISPVTLPTPTVGNAYNVSITDNGAVGAYTLTESGSLPPGLTLSGGQIAGSITHVQDSGLRETSSGTSMTAPHFATTPVAGDAIVVWAWGWTNAVVTSKEVTCTDTAGNSYTQYAFEDGGSGNGNWSCVFVATNIKSAANFSPTVTLAGMPNGNVEIAASEFSGVGGVDASGTNSGTTAAPNIQLTTSHAADLLCAIMACNNTTNPATVNTPSGWTQSAVVTDGNSYEVGQALYRVAGSAGSYAAQWNQIGTTAWGTGVVALEASTQSGGTLSGTPTTPGTSTFTITGTDSAGNIASQGYTLTVNPALVIAPTSLTAATVNNAYDTAFRATGGSGTGYSFIESGSLPAGITFSNGLLSGTPSNSGSFPITITVTDSNNAIASINEILTVNPVVVVSPTVLANPTVSNAYSMSFTASGGSGSGYTFSESGALPNGLTFNGSGLLNGTPTQAGTFSFTVTATDNNGGTGSATYTLSVNPAVVITPTVLPTGTVNDSYDVSFTATGGSGRGYTYTESGALPSGLTFSNGILSGIPTQSGSFSILVTAKDSNGGTSTISDTLMVNAPVVVSPTTLAPAIAGKPYAVNFTATGGSGTGYVFAESGALPTGLSFSNGTLSGTPTVPGTFPITVTATDSNGGTGSVTESLTVNSAGVLVTPASLSTGTVNNAYAVTFTATGGSGTGYTFVETGALPNGLTFNANGTLTGTPTQAGTFSITVTATDSNGDTGSVTDTLSVNPAVVVTPTTLPIATVNNAYSVAFTATGGSGAGYTYTESGALPSGLTFSNGILSGKPTQSGSFSIMVTAKDNNGGTSSVTDTLQIHSAIVVSPSTLSTASYNSPYSVTFTATGGSGSGFTFSESGTLPTGLTFSNGTLVGTPTQLGTFPLTIAATDSVGAVGTVTDNLTVAETTSPTVSITNPGSGATVTGTITVSANASDAVGITGVQFQLDGVNLGSEITAAPYQLSWNSTTVGNGTHTLTAIAYNVGGLSTTASETVTVSNVTTNAVRPDPVSLNTSSPQYQGLVADFPLWVSSPTADAVDLGPHGLVGTPTNVMAANDPVMGPTFAADGTQRNYEIPYNTATDFAYPNDTPQAFSLSCWVRITISSNSLTNSDNPNNMYMLTFDANDAASFPGYGFGVAATLADNGPIVAEFDVDGHEAQASMFGKTPINDGNWHLIVATYTPDLTFGSVDSMGKIYVDGVLDSTSNNMAQLESPTVETHLLNPIAEYIGTDDDGHSNAFQGDIADLRFYQGALTSTQIAAMYAPATRWQLYTASPSFALTGSSSTVTAGTPATVTGTAMNPNGTLDTGYAGTVQIASSDPRAILPSPAMLNNNAGTFSATVTTAGAQSITATNTANGIVGSNAGITVNPAAPSQGVSTQLPTTGIAGDTLSTVLASLEDRFGNVETYDNGDTITLSVHSGPSTQLGGTLSAPVHQGVATFATLLDASGSYTLAAQASLTSGGILGPTYSSSITVNTPVSVSLDSITLNSHTGLYAETVTLSNTSGATLIGPILLTFTGLANGLVLTNANGTIDGDSYVNFLTVAQTLRDRRSMTITLIFSAADSNGIS